MANFKKMTASQVKEKQNNTMRKQLLDIIDNLDKANKGEINLDNWQCPWIAEGSGLIPVNVNGKEYDGILNMIMLLSAQHKCAYSSNVWKTFAQWKKEGIQITDTSEYTTIFFNKPQVYKTVDQTTGEEESRSIWIMKAYAMYNASNTNSEEGKTEKIEHINPDKRIKEIDEYVSKTGAKVIEKNGNSAHYRPSTDEITLPEYNQFKSATMFAQTKLHELIHWTGHTSRLDRHRKGITFGSEEYAFEELIAELGSAVSMYKQGFAPSGIQHIEYIASWIKRLKNDPKVLYKAGAKANKAIAHIDKLVA
jgi:antirestriction protein ArdC